MAALTQRTIWQARQAIAPLVRRTPLVRSETLSRQLGQNVYLKLETQQQTGAFKLRGATNRSCSSSEVERARGVVAVSTGNHARAVAHAASVQGVRAVVCMSPLVPANKVEAVRALGAEIQIVGRNQDEAEVVAKQLAAERGLTFVSPFDDPFVIAGQGTIGLELLEDLPALDRVLVPLSGGGLIGGIALALKSADPMIRVIGVSMERGPAMVLSLAAGRPVAVEEEPSLADSLGGGIGLDNRYTFASGARARRRDRPGQRGRRSRPRCAIATGRSGRSSRAVPRSGSRPCSRARSGRRARVSRSY